MNFAFQKKNRLPKKKYGGIIFMVKVVNKGLKVEILPYESKKHVINQNIGNARFIWNNILARYNYLYHVILFLWLFFKPEYP